MDSRPARTLLAIIAWVIATFIIINNIIFEKPLDEWWLPLILVVLGLVLALYPSGKASAEAAEVTAEPDAPSLTPVVATPEPEAEPVQEVDLAAAIEAAVSDAPIAETPVTPEPEPVSAPEAAPEVRVDVINSPEEQHRVSGGDDSVVVDASEAASIVGFSTLIDGAEAVEENTAIESPPTDAAPEATPEEATTVSDEPEPEPVVAEEAEAITDAETPQSAVETADVPVVEAVEDVTEAPAAEAPVTPEPVEEAATVEEPAAKAPATRAKKAASAADGPDDLTKIEGIGPKMSKALVAAGIDSFVKLSDSSEEQLRDAIAAAGMRFAPSIPTWAEQASYAAKGDWDGLQGFQDQLIAGRRPE